MNEEDYDPELDDDYYEDGTAPEDMDDESLGGCGNFGEQLYDAGTELCEFCPQSEECHTMFRDWMKRTHGGTRAP